MSKVYAIMEGNGYYGGDHDDLNYNNEWFVCVYQNEELAKEHLKKWEENIRKMCPYLCSDNYRWIHEDREVYVGDVGEYGNDEYGAWNYCQYIETNVLHEIKLE